MSKTPTDNRQAPPQGLKTPQAAILTAKPWGKIPPLTRADIKPWGKLPRW